MEIKSRIRRLARNSRLPRADFLFLIAIFVVLASSVAHAHSVSINWRFHIVDADDIRHSAANYVSAERDGTLAALVFAGSQLMRFTLDPQGDPYPFQLVQDEGQNRALLVLTAGTWPSIERLPQGKVPAQTFGNLTAPADILPGLALQLQYDTLDLAGVLGPGQLLVRSLGRPRLPLIGLQVVG